MIDLKTTNPAYDLAMEMLCCLSTSPVLIKTLKRDFGLEHSKDVRRLLRGLGERGLDVQFGSVLDGTRPGREARGYMPSVTGGYAWVEPEDWLKVQDACEDYWLAVYDLQDALDDEPDEEELEELAGMVRNAPDGPVVAVAAPAPPPTKVGVRLN